MPQRFATARPGGIVCWTKPGQVMIEAVIAVLFLAFLFLLMFQLSRLMMGKIMVEHAAMRVARARAVGLNEFMCLKAARIAAIPASGRRLHPTKDDVRGKMSETALAHMYMRTPDNSYANGLLVYEYWCRLDVRPGHGSGASTTALKTDWATLRGEARVDAFPVYLNDEGL